MSDANTEQSDENTEVSDENTEESDENTEECDENTEECEVRSPKSWLMRLMESSSFLSARFTSTRRTHCSFFSRNASLNRS